MDSYFFSYTVWRQIFEGHNFRGLPFWKISRKQFSRIEDSGGPRPLLDCRTWCGSCGQVTCTLYARTCENLSSTQKATALEMETFSIEVMVRGYHVNKDIWDATLGEQQCCRKEPRNNQDPFAVVVVRSQVIVGHVPRKISSIARLYSRLTQLLYHCSY